MTDAPGDQAYPISATVFILMYKQPKDPARSHETTLAFFKWALENGQDLANVARLCAAAAAARPADRGLLASADSLMRGTGSASLRQSHTPRGNDLHVRDIDAFPQPIAGSQHRRGGARQTGRRDLPRRCCRLPAGSCSSASARRPCRCSTAAFPPSRNSGFGFLYRTAWDPVRQDFGAAVPIYGTIVTSGHRDADRGADQLRHRRLPERSMSRRSARADRLGDRAARRHSQHYLRHVGPVRVRALHVRPHRALAYRQCRAAAADRLPVRRAAARHRHADRRHHPRGDGDPVHLFRHARCVRARAAALARGGLRPRRDPLGGRARRGRCPTRARPWSAASFSVSAARSARPWR